jgi:hypothetical protein
MLEFESSAKDAVNVQATEAWLHHKLKESLFFAEELVRLRGNPDDRVAVQKIKDALVWSLYSPTVRNIQIFSSNEGKGDKGNDE